MAKVYVHGDEMAAIKPHGETVTMQVNEDAIRHLIRGKFGKRHGIINLGSTKLGLDENGAYVQYDL